MSFPRYPKYKDSGVEWLGEVPEHWSVEPFKHLIARNDGGVWGDDPDGLSDTIVLRSTEQSVNGYWQLDDPAPRKLSESEVSGALLVEGDLLLTKSSGSSLHIGKTTLVTSEIAAMRCCYSNFMQRIRMRTSFSPKLAWHVLNNDLVRRQFNLLSNSTTGLANLNGTMIGQAVVPVPPLPEQTKIAAFLDRETAKIDELVAEQQHLIELLKEKRQAVISHAVTKGLDPNAPTKLSGIDWLGDVPAYWEVGPVKRFADVIDCKHFTVEFLDEGMPIASIRELRNDQIDLSNAKRTSKREWDFLREGRDPRRGDLIFCRNASVGAVGYVDFDEPFCMGQDVCLIRPNTTCRFLHYQLTSSLVRCQIEALLVGATIRRANVEEIRNLIVVHPPANEQHAIAAFLDGETAKFESLTAEAQRAVDLLRERRTALISAAVTGQIDVRELASTESLEVAA